MRLRFQLALILAAAAWAGTASADETTFCNAYITSLPYTITTQGHYCFKQNLSTAIGAGNAITVASDFVLIDLNGFKLGGGGAGPATLAEGINTNGHANVTIRGGNIRGFYIGVHVQTGTFSRNNRVEDVALDSNTYIGVLVSSPNPGAVVRGCTVSDTGGSTQGTPYAIGIWNDESSDSSTEDNFVFGTVHPVSPYGIVGNGWVVRNIVNGDSPAGSVCFFNSSTTLYRQNDARGCNVSYDGGTNAGGNYP